MSDDFLAAEAGVDTSEPIEGIEFAAGTYTYRHTSSDQSVVINGKTFEPATIERSDAALSAVGAAAVMTIQLPVSHPLAQRYLVNGVPPRQILATIWRRQGAVVEQLWCGYVVSMAVNRHVASFLVPSRSGDAMARYLPVLTAGRGCPHMLYDANCRVDRTAYAVAATVTLVEGRDVTLSTVDGQSDHWAMWGELLHVESGERMMVVEQISTLVTLRFPIYELAVGASVVLYAGCAHDIATCNNKFGNHINFGGEPQLPLDNVFIKAGT